METVLFDFDETIIDHKVWSPARNIHIAKLLGISLKEYLAIHEEYKKQLPRPQDFSLDELIKIIGIKLKRDVSFIYNEYFNKEIMQHALFNDVIPTLDYLKEQGVKIGIYTAGSYDFQYKRISIIGILKYIEKDLIFIHKEKDSKDFINTLPKSYVVDDNELIVNTLANFEHITPILINRIKKENDLNSRVIEINSLLKLKEII